VREEGNPDLSHAAELVDEVPEAETALRGPFYLVEILEREDDQGLLGVEGVSDAEGQAFFGVLITGSGRVRIWSDSDIEVLSYAHLTLTYLLVTLS